MIHSARTYLPAEFIITDWEALLPWFEKLFENQIDSVQELESWLISLSELQAAIYEEQAWRYIRMTCNTQDEKIKASFHDFVQNILPHLAPWQHKLNEKLYSSPYLDQLDPSKYVPLIREVKKDISIYREDNIPLRSKIQTKAQEFGAISGGLTIEHEEETLTLQKAGAMLEQQDRNLRESIWKRSPKFG